MVFPYERRLRPRKALYFRHKLRTLLAAYARGEATLEQVTAGVQGWVNHVHHYGNTVDLRKAVLGQPFVSTGGRI